MSDPDQLADLQRALTSVVRRLGLLRPIFPPGLLPAGTDKAGYIALATLVEGGSVRLSDLASSLLLDVSTVSRQVRALEDGGLIARSADPDDGRASRLAATDRGRKAVSIVSAARSEQLAKALRDWSSADVATLTRLLGAFAASLPGPDTTSPTAPAAGHEKEMASR